MFYASREWKQVREAVILRDNGCDLGVPGFEINGALVVHHINPIKEDDIVHSHEWVLNPEFLITTTHDTHNAIHYGDSSLLRTEFVERKPGDTRLW
jgi:5-methylcytosine-specific restriction endonuclease McrA